MSDVYSDHYWQSKFTVTQADMDRLEARIAKTGKAHELDAMTKRIIRGRLRHGAEISPAARGVQAALADHSVRLWDPAGKWEVGDHVVIWTWSFARRANEVKIGVDRDSIVALVREMGVDDLRSY